MSFEDDAPIANADWVTVPSSVDTVYGNVIEGKWGTQAGSLDKSADGTTGSATDAEGADGASVYRVRLHSDVPGDHSGEDDKWITLDQGIENDPHGKYAEVTNDNGTLRIFADGYYEFSPKGTYTPIFGGGAGYPGNANSWGQSDSYNNYTYSVVRVTKSGTDLDRLEYPSKNPNGQFDIEGQAAGTGGGMGIKGGNSLGNEIDRAGSSYNEGVLITPPSGNLTAMEFTFSGLDGTEKVRWVAYGTDGKELASGETTANKLTITCPSAIGNVLIYADDNNTGFRIKEISAGQSGTRGEQCYDYELKDGDGDTSMSQLHIHNATQLDVAATTNVTVDEAHLSQSSVSDIPGGFGNDLLVGIAGSDPLHGDAAHNLHVGAGASDLLGSIGSDVLKDNTEDDLLVGGSLHYNGLEGEAALASLAEDAGSSQVRDIANYLQENIHLLGQGSEADGNNILHGGKGNDLLISGGGDDTIFGHEGDDILFGGAGNDELHGGHGNDTMFGGDGADVMYGGPGNDTMSGGEGADTFAWAKGDLTGESHDVIMDFDYGEDKLRFDDIFNEENSLSHMLESIKITEIQEDRLFLKVMSENSMDKGDVIELNMGADTEYRELYNQYISEPENETLKNSIQETLIKHIIENCH